MTKQSTITKNDTKYRLTAFVDPSIAKRAKIQGALENLTLSEVVEKALDVYSPRLEKNTDQQIRLRFNRPPSLGVKTPAEDMRSKRIAPKRTKDLTVPR